MEFLESLNGFYQMKNKEGDYFNALVAPFRLIIPDHVN